VSKARAKSSGPSSASATASRPAGGEEDDAGARLTRELELLFPGVEVPEELSPRDRKFWIVYRQAAMQGHRGVANLANSAIESLGKGVDADIVDRNKRRDAELADLRERRQAELKDRDRRRKGEEERADKRLDQEIGERKTESRDRSRERNLFMLLTALSVVGTIVLVAISPIPAQPSFSSGMGLVLSAGGVYRLRMLAPS
jgi:hypothetical protein